jgi:hypothetical protein
MVKIVTSWYTLFRLAHELGQARLYGTPAEIAAAEEAHSAYEALFLKSDEHIHSPYWDDNVIGQ